MLLIATHGSVAASAAWAGDVVDSSGRGHSLVSGPRLRRAPARGAVGAAKITPGESFRTYPGISNEISNIRGPASV